MATGNHKKKQISSSQRGRVLISLLGVLILCLSLPSPLTNPEMVFSESIPQFPRTFESKSLSSAGSSGSDIESLMVYSREIQGLDFALMNSFSNTSSHLKTLDFSGYHIAGWSLYELQITPSRIAALSEHEIVGSSTTPTGDSELQIYEHSGDVYYDQLAQAFYNMSHSGKLENISILYACTQYDPSTQNYAYLDIRSDYQDGSTNMVSSVQLANVGFTPTWANVTESVILSADTPYYAVINGTKLIEVSNFYPYIWWYYENDPGTYLTRRYNTDGDTWGSNRPYEALMNYTYIPWNTTSDSALEFTNPLALSLQGNSSSLSGSDWLFSSTSNVSLVQFSSNQSISIEYDLTLRYKQSISSTTTWYAGSSGSDVSWNITSVADFPELSGSQDKNLTLILPNDWTANHLFNATYPTQYYDQFSQDGSSVKCTLLGDETWILECTSPNYLQSISKYDNSDDSTITDKVSVSVTMDINSTVESPLSVIAANGEASLRVFYQSSVEYAENFTVTAGKSYHQWDISTDSSSNGLYSIDIYWTNGSEAGYRTTDVLVFYETTLVADDYSIDAFTDNSFYIGIDYDQVFPVGGIDDAAADVTYSFGSVVNQSLVDQSNGRWDATVLTTSMSPGTYDLHVYAKGYALENRSLTIQVTLTHDTEALTVTWSNGNDITYVQTTELVVYYNRVTGSTPIPDATVNVTIDTKNWTLTWDSVSAYRITFNGTDVPPGFDLHSLTIEAWKAGHKEQIDVTQTLNISPEPTTMEYEWSSTNDITYIESTTLIVNYTMSDGSPVVGAIVNVTIGSDLYNLTWNGETYEYVFDGDAALPSFGDHSLNITADKFGFDFKDALSVPLTISLEPTTMTYEWSNGNVITYVESTTLIVNYTMSDGSPVSGAAVNVTIGSLNPFYLTFNGSVYKYVFDGDATLPGLDVHSLSIFAGKHGYANKTTSPVSLTIDEEPTTLVISWSAGNNISYVGETYLIANYTMSSGSAVIGAVLNVTIDAYLPWDLVWHAPTQTYRVLFSGMDNPPGLGTHSLSILADLFGYAEKSNTSQMILRNEATTLVLGWTDGNNITYVGQTVLFANYTMDNGTAIRNAMVNVSIGGASPLEMTWDNDTDTYRIVFLGSDDPPGLGNHNVLVLADLFGYRDQSDASYLNITVDPTTIEISWSHGTTITYVGQTKLTVTYRMNDTTPIGPDANVTALIGTTLFNLTWNPGSSSYEITFNGTDNPPDIGTYKVIIGANKFGFQTQSNDTYWLTINIEPTTLELSWLPSDTIPYVNQTVLYANYSMSDGSPVRGAYVNASIASREWVFEWNEPSEMYMLILYGNHPDLDVGTFPVTVHATLYGFDSLNDTAETLTVNEEVTDLVLSWSYGNSPGYFNYTFLFADYRMSNLTTIRNATLTITIDTIIWDMIWNETASMYQVRFNGSDSPPGYGEHNLTIQASKYGFIPQTNDTLKLTLPVIPSTIEIIWSNGNSITFVENTTLRIQYAMYNGSIVTGAIVYIAIGVRIYPMTLIGDYYERIFLGSDEEPGFGNHSTTIHALKNGFEPFLIEDEVLEIDQEPTSFDINWSNGYNISYVSGTFVSVKYQMSNNDPIPDALVNVTINEKFWNLTWNATDGTYYAYIAGNENPPGYGTYTVEIRASKYGYDPLYNTEYNLTIHLEETYFVFEWDPSETITFLGQTKLRIFYLMSNGTPIPEAVVNATRGATWDADWNSTSEAYEITWVGNGPFAIGTHILEIRAGKADYVGLVNNSQALIIIEEPTLIMASWSNGDSITYVESTTLVVNYTTTDGTMIPDAWVDVTIGSDNWQVEWNGTVYELTFSNSSSAWPGLGSFELSIRGWKNGYATTVNKNYSLTILSEQVSISSELLNGSTITYVGYTILQVNYTTTEGAPITGAMVNVTANSVLWNLTWDASSETYRIRFNGSDSSPGIGFHSLVVNASAYGFDPLTSTLFLTIDPEPTTLVPSWGAPNFNSLTYFEYTILYVEYRMNNGSVIPGASVNVTIGLEKWTLDWNTTAGAYSLRFNGSDAPPGLGTHTISLEAGLYGYIDASNSSSLTLARDPTTIEVSWTNGNDITFVEYTVLSVVYRMSNGSEILGAVLNATIGAYPPWTLTWNGTAGAYQVRFDGNQDPPGFGTFIVDILASASVYTSQSTSTSLTLGTEGTTATPSWVSTTFDWTESVILSFDFRDTYGTLIDDASTRVVYVDGVPMGLLGTNGTYWIEFDNSYDLGLHNVWANFSKFGYEPSTALSISFTIDEAQTDLTIDWSSIVIDYLGQIDLTVDYYYVASGTSVPSAGVVVNITIDGTTTLDLTLQNNLWIANLTGDYLDLGSHTVGIRAQVYGYEYSESLGWLLTVNEVSTDTLAVTWNPSNLTIEYTDSFILSVDYTFAGVDVPDTATLNVSIEGLLYDLTYSAGIWSVSIPGNELGIGVRTASISAWHYGYQLQTDITVGLNVTVAANSFIATWEPLDLQATYIDTVNLSVIYTEDFVPIGGATVELSINATTYTLTYSAVDEMWHFSMRASDIGVGVWNVTVTANKTGYADGWDSRLLTISVTPTNFTVIRSSSTIYYDESVTLNIYYQLLNNSVVPGATCTVTVDSVAQSTVWDTDHWTITLAGSTLGLGVHSVVIDVDAFGYEPDTDSFEITVEAIPTSVSVGPGLYEVFPFDTVNVSFTWMDDKNSIGLGGSVPSVIWPDGYSIVDLGNGTYSITVNNTAMHVGVYQLNVTFTRPGYTTGDRMVEIEILELPIVLSFQDEINQFENETITVSIQIFDGPHATVVDWGEIVIELEGVQYQLVYLPGTQEYSVDIWLGSLVPGTYTLNFTATATDCETETGVIQLEIEHKILYTLVIEVDEQVTAGQVVQITILASYESGPLEGFEVEVHILVERGEAAPQEYIEFASDSLEFLVPSDATQLSIWAEFEGAEGEWPAVSNTVNREVTPGGMNILSFVDPITLTIIFGGGGGSLAGLILLRRRRRGIPTSSSVTEAIVAPTTAPAAPMGEMDILKDKIKGSADGLNREQIAESLEISKSKAEKMMKKVLESDSGFEIVEKGALRRIRFKGD